MDSSCTTKCLMGTSFRPSSPQSTPTFSTVPSMFVAVPTARPTYEPYMSFTGFPIILSFFSFIA